MLFQYQKKKAKSENRKWKNVETWIFTYKMAMPLKCLFVD